MTKSKQNIRNLFGSNTTYVKLRTQENYNIQDPYNEHTISRCAFIFFFIVGFRDRCHPLGFIKHCYFQKVNRLLTIMNY